MSNRDFDAYTKDTMNAFDLLAAQLPADNECIAKLDSELTMLIDEYVEKINQVDSLNDEKDGLQSEIDDLKNEVEDLESEVEDLEYKVSELESED